MFYKIKTPPPFVNGRGVFLYGFFAAAQSIPQPPSLSLKDQCAMKKGKGRYIPLLGKEGLGVVDLGGSHRTFVIQIFKN